MSQFLADRDLHLNDQALAVLAMLSRAEPSGVSTFDEKTREYQIETTTTAWYNGRERGICLVVRLSMMSKQALIITFGECRSSDSIFVDSWVTEKHFLNPPTHADFTDEAYAKRTYVPHGEVGKAVEVIRDKIKEFLDAESAPVAARVLPDLGDDDVVDVAVHGFTTSLSRSQLTRGRRAG